MRKDETMNEETKNAMEALGVDAVGAPANPAGDGEIDWKAKYEEAQRHSMYLVISVGLSAIGSAIYLAAIGQFEAKYFTALLIAIYGLNQTFYSIFANLSLNDLIACVLDKTIEKLSEKK